jgi:hypothetical protein
MKVNGNIINEDVQINIKNLNNESKEVRLDALKELLKNKELIESYTKSKKYSLVNNHIHTEYSFSPYSPTKAIWMAYNIGLNTAGIMDHESLVGAYEFKEAGKIAGIATTVGIEFRADFSRTKLAGRKLNNPDQKSIAYITMHGIPESKIPIVDEYFSKYRNKRNLRNRKMIDKINNLMKDFGICLNFESDIIPISKFYESGSITERHILFALSLKLIDNYGKNEDLLNLLKNDLKIEINSKLYDYLSDSKNPYYEYDLLGLLKSDLLERIYIDAKEECPDIREVIEFNKQIGGILAYAYLGDVCGSTTGDKKNQKFEDDYLELLFEEISNIGFYAMTYMPSRNTLLQLERVRSLSDKYNFFQISGEDINSPRQSFICKELENPVFNNLIESTWALIGHERETDKAIEKGMFSDYIISKYPNIEDRISYFAEMGRS